MTIYDIAKKAGVSASSVSRVVNNKPGVNPETREKIKKLLKEYNYVANEAARGLVTKSNRDGRCLGDHQDPVQQRVLHPDPQYRQYR